MPSLLLQRLIAAFPDAVTAAAFLILWIAPMALGESAVRSLGLQADVVAALGLPGGGLWVEQPHRLLAFGFLYFAVLALYKWFEAGLAPGRGSTMRSSARVRSR